MLTEEASSIFRANTFAHLALVDEKGHPHVSPMWVDLDSNNRIVINTAEGRVKARLLRVGTPVAISATDPKSPYRYVGVRGTVVERTHEGAHAVIEALAKKYRGVASFPLSPGEQRVTIRIEPTSVYMRG